MCSPEVRCGGAELAESAELEWLPLVGRGVHFGEAARPDWGVDSPIVLLGRAEPAASAEFAELEWLPLVGRGVRSAWEQKPDRLVDLGLSVATPAGRGWSEWEVWQSARCVGRGR